MQETNHPTLKADSTSLTQGVGPQRAHRRFDAIPRLTRNRVEALKAHTRQYEVGDPACPGLQLRVAVAGLKMFSDDTRDVRPITDVIGRTR
jgi:hypothetical protein